MSGIDFKTLRRALGLSQLALANRLGVSRRQVWLLEKKSDVGPMVTLAMKALADEHMAALSQAVAA